MKKLALFVSACLCLQAANGFAQKGKIERITSVDYAQLTDIVLNYFSVDEEQMKQRKKLATHFTEMMREVQRTRHAQKNRDKLKLAEMTPYQQMEAALSAMRIL